MHPIPDEVRLIRAERQGLRLAILCRTIAVGAAFLWLVGGSWLAGYAPNPWGLGALLAFTVFGVLSLLAIGTRFDRWWLKYVLYAADILGVCALFALLPVSRGDEVPQIIAFRAYGIYYLFPLIAMACLSLSWRLVAWSGAVAVLGWWSAFAAVVAGMDRRLSWGDVPDDATRDVYETVFLSFDFIGIGNRVEETGFLLAGAVILALAVYRARRVFFAQISAEAQRETERAERERIAETLGRFVPHAIAERLIADKSALAPHVRHGAVLILDVRGFTTFADGKDPEDVIRALNEFLAHCADVISSENGVVISFTGDGLLATFNTPLAIAEPERAAFAAAERLTGAATPGSFGFRIGIAAGPVAAGSVGSSKRQAFTVYGDTVNRAARLEALAKEVQETTLLDQAVADKLDDKSNIRPLGPHAIRGFTESIHVWAGPAP